VSRAAIFPVSKRLSDVECIVARDSEEEVRGREKRRRDCAGKHTWGLVLVLVGSLPSVNECGIYSDVCLPSYIFFKRMKVVVG
jgi:hypothetical protein